MILRMIFLHTSGERERERVCAGVGVCVCVCVRMCVYKVDLKIFLERKKFCAKISTNGSGDR